MRCAGQYSRPADRKIVGTFFKSKKPCNFALEGEFWRSAALRLPSNVPLAISMPREATADQRQAKERDRFERWLLLLDKQRLRIESLPDSFCEERLAKLDVTLPAGQTGREELRKSLSQKRIVVPRESVASLPACIRLFLIAPISLCWLLVSFLVNDDYGIALVLDASCNTLAYLTFGQPYPMSTNRYWRSNNGWLARPASQEALYASPESIKSFPIYDGANSHWQGATKDYMRSAYNDYRRKVDSNPYESPDYEVTQRRSTAASSRQLDISALDEILMNTSTLGCQRPMERRHSETWRSNFLAKRQQFATNDSTDCRVRKELLIAKAAAPDGPTFAEDPSQRQQFINGKFKDRLYLERSYSDQHLPDYVRQSWRHPALDNSVSCTLPRKSQPTPMQRSSSWNVANYRNDGGERSRSRSKGGQPSWNAWNTVVEAIIAEREQQREESDCYRSPWRTQSLPRFYGTRHAQPTVAPNFSELDSILTNLGVANDQQVPLASAKQLNGPTAFVGKQNAPSSSHSSRVPFRLSTAGSVAERIQQFEKRPDGALCKLSEYPRQQLRLSLHEASNPRIWDTTLPLNVHYVHSPCQKVAQGASSTVTPTLSVRRDLETVPSAQISRPETKKPFPRVDVPRFYFPYGKSNDQNELETVLRRAAGIFKNYGGRACLNRFGEVAEAVGLPYYVRQPLFSICGGDACEYVTFQSFEKFWRRITQTRHDEAALFVRILTKDTADYLLPMDFTAVVQDIINDHPGLLCLRQARAFYSTYLETVISRIYYNVSRNWSDRISVEELRRSNFLATLRRLGEVDDINQVRDYFSYEHFYVIYCTFWRLDFDHDLFISKSDLSVYNNFALSSRIIDRIFSKAVNANLSEPDGKMAYPDFVWFILAEEDKEHPKSIEYWFRCMDLDGDGYLSIYELEYFYEEQAMRLEAIEICAPAFTDILCQMLDLVKPREKEKISLRDLKRCSHAAYFFDTFLNREKYLQLEESEPNKVAEESHPELSSAWDRFAAREYQQFLAKEESPEDTEINCDTDTDEEGNVRVASDYHRLAERVSSFTGKSI
uniref:EF-hand domain-containing protein n=1 Tax=Trichuris muris TaxID=70415 RepID=A0A5S6R4C2_TRIMR